MNSFLPIAAPEWPDFYHCDEFYGRLNWADCDFAVALLPRGAATVSYGNQGGASTWEIPQTVHFGDCQVSFTAAGQNWHGADSFPFVPDRVREMAGWVARNCAQSLGVGGFITSNISNTVDYITSPTTDLTQQLYPEDTTFFTVTVSGVTEDDLDYPGDYDPVTGAVLYDAIHGALQASQFGSSLWNHFSSAASLFSSHYVSMTRGGGQSWYGPTQETALDEMAYECDAKLGNPREVDCSQLLYSQLGNSSEIIEVEPGSVFFVQQSTCMVAISSIAYVALTWGMIVPYVRTLVEYCAENPLWDSVGGQAFFSSVPSLVGIGGRRKKSRRKRDDTGLEALPHGVNITLFGQLEDFINATAELETCTWQNASGGKDVRSCPVPHHRRPTI